MPNDFQQYLLGLPQDQFDSLYKQFQSAKAEPFSGARRKSFGTMGIATPQDTQFAAQAQNVASQVGKDIYANTLEDPVNRVKSWGTLINPNATEEEKRAARDYVAPLPVTPEGYINEEGMSRAAGPMLGITTYHGSPTSGIRKMDLKYIGSGEGAQAYGHGTYTAGGRDIAEWYRDKLGANTTEPPLRFYKGQKLEPSTPEYHAATLLDSTGLTLAGVKKEVAGWIKNAKEGEDVAHYQSVQDFLNTVGSKKDFKRKQPQGRLYTTELLGHPDEYLAWDKPLSEQSEKVKAALEKGQWDNKGIVGHWMDRSSENPAYDGEDLYIRLSGTVGSDKAASEYLHSKGISGIKYLDNPSRKVGEGTHNYVTFKPESDIVITHENGQRIPGAVEEAYRNIRDPESKAKLLERYPDLKDTLMGAAPIAAAGLLGGKDDTVRNDGTKKGNGYFGALPMQDGSKKVATELAVGVNLGGKEVEIPTLVPTLTSREIDHLLKGKKPTPTIMKKAILHARDRIKKGLSPFASSGDFQGD